MPNATRRMVISSAGFLSRSKVHYPPRALRDVVFAFTMARNRKDPPIDLRKLLTGIKNLEVLRRVSPTHERYHEFIEKVRQSVAGQLALVARDSTELHDFLKKHRFVLIDGNGHITGTNTRSFLGIGRARIPCADILWLINRLN